MTERTQAAAAPSRRRLSAPARRAAILADATEVFAGEGFAEASLDDVAARGGISKALIYEHFESKRDLQLALLESSVGELTRRVVTAIEGAPGDEERLRTGIEAFLDFAEERPAALALLTRNVADPVVGAALDRMREGMAATLAAMMAADAPPRQPGDLDVELTSAALAHLIAGGVQFVAGWWPEAAERGLTRERLVEVAMGIYWLGLDRLVAGERWGR